MENQSEMTKSGENVTVDEARKQLYVVKPFFLPDLDGDILILPGSSVEILDDYEKYTNLLVRIADTDGSELCKEGWGCMFWLEKENQTQEYWDENHEDDENFVSIDRELLDGHTRELTEEQMQNELALNPVNPTELCAEHDHRKHIDDIADHIIEAHERIDRMTVEECLSTLSKHPKSKDTVRQDLKDEYDAKLCLRTFLF